MRYKMRRIYALLCCITVLLATVYKSNLVKAGQGEVYNEALSEYAIIVEGYNTALEKFESISNENMVLSAQISYKAIDELLQDFRVNMEAENVSENSIDSGVCIKYENIVSLYNYLYSKVRVDLLDYKLEIDDIRSKTLDNSEKNKLLELSTSADNLYSATASTVTSMKNFIEKYKDNKTYSDGVTILIDYREGTLQGKSNMTLERFPEEKIGILSPTRENCIFDGWEILEGDSTVVLNNGSYILTVGTIDTVIRAKWKNFDGSDIEDTPDPVAKQISVSISLEGGIFNNETTIVKQVNESDTVVLFENVDLIRREGYKVSGFTSLYGGTCKILEDNSVVYTAPNYSSTTIDIVNAIWEKIDSSVSEPNIEPTTNTIYINYNGGVNSETGKSEEVFYSEVNETKLLFSKGCITREGYTLEKLEISEGCSLIEQNGNIILAATDYKKEGIIINAIWREVTSETPAVITSNIPEPVATTAVPSSTSPVEVNTPTISPTEIVDPTIAPIQQAQTTVAPTAAVKPPTLTLSTNNVIMGKLEKVQVTYKTNSTSGVTWESKNNKIASVDSKGNIIGKAVGSTTITVKTGVTSKTIKVLVKSAPSKLGLNKSMKAKATWTIKKGKTKQINLYFKVGAYSNAITFKSNSTKIATVSKKGLIKAKRIGKAKITAKTYNGKKAVITLKVKKK